MFSDRIWKSWLVLNFRYLKEWCYRFVEEQHNWKCDDLLMYKLKVWPIADYLVSPENGQVDIIIIKSFIKVAKLSSG